MAKAPGSVFGAPGLPTEFTAEQAPEEPLAALTAFLTPYRDAQHAAADPRLQAVTAA
jgi:hypothetical protein